MRYQHHEFFHRENEIESNDLTSYRRASPKENIGFYINKNTIYTHVCQMKKARLCAVDL